MFVAEEIGDERRAWTIIDVARIAILHDGTCVHDGDAVGQGERLVLIMGNKNEGDSELALQLFQLDLHPLAQFQVEGAQRFVEQQDLRTLDQGACQGGALLLPTAHLARVATAETFKIDQRQVFFGLRSDPAADLRGCPGKVRFKPNATFCAAVRWGNKA